MFWNRNRRRQRLRETPLTPEQRAILSRNVPVYDDLSDDDRDRLDGMIRVFLDEKTFEGGHGFEITEEIRVTIAAQACILLLGLNPKRIYPGLKSIIVYPSTYVATSRNVGPGGVVTESNDARAGESWNHTTGWGASSGGPVVLSWCDVLRGGADVNDGHNVVFHEFAHQLDGQATGMDGAPPLPSRSRYIAWARVLGDEFKNLRRDLMTRQPTELRPYGATNPAEFFAVATETYFERPEALRQRHPELYDQLKQFYDWEPPEP